MAFFEKALKAKVMSTYILIRGNVSKKILYEAYKIATDFEQRYSAYKKDSFVSLLNQEAHNHPVECERDDILLFERSFEASRHTQGEFDISIGALSHSAYHFGFSNQRVASKEELLKQKKLVNYKFIKVEPQGISFEKEGVRVDFGGIGKGYVAKLIALFLQKKGATKLLVDVGGEIVTLGKKYTIAIKNPFKDGNIAYIKSSKEPLSISTSGDYERFIDSRENHHILSIQSAKSANIYSSMTVMRNGFDIDLLDAYATALFNKDLVYVQKFSQKMHLATITVDSDKNISFNNTESLELSSIELLNKES